MARMPQLEPLTFVMHKPFSYRDAERKFGNTPVPRIPAVPFYDPSDQEKRTPSYVMPREEERQRFFEFNYAKYRYNREVDRQSVRGSKRKALFWHVRVVHLEEFLTRTNLPLVYSTVARTQNRYKYLDFDEAVSEGGLALTRAVHGNDTSRLTNKFSTYAVHIILNALSAADRKKAKRAARVTTVELPELYSDDEPTMSEKEDNAEELATLANCLMNNDAELTPTQELVIKHRFGLGGVKQLTLEEVGDKIGVSKERVRQIQNSVLERLRRSLGALE